MGAPIEHPSRIPDARRAAAILRALGHARVRAEGITPVTVDELARVLDLADAAIDDPPADHAIRFAAGGLAEDRLEALVMCGADAYVEIASVDCDLRVWPTRAWVHAVTMPAGGRMRAIELLAPLGIAHRLVPERGRQAFAPELAVEFDRLPNLALELTTPDRAAALAIFRALATAREARPVLVGGLVMTPNHAAIAALRTYLPATHAAIDAELVLAPERAADLAEHVVADQWRAGELAYELRTGRLSWLPRAPVATAAADAWRALVDAALGTC